MKKTTTVLGKIRKSKWRKRVITWLTLYAFYLQASMQALAVPLASGVIQQDLGTNPLFERSTNNSDFQYVTNDVMEHSAPAATTLASFYADIFDSHKEILGEPNYVPVMVGDITVILPIYDKPKYVGSPLVQSRYIRYQIRSLLGRNLIDGEDSKYANEAAQINTLYQHAKDFIQYERPDIGFGEPLTLDQEASGLAQDMVWPEYRTINGEKVLVPVVYLTQSTVAERRVNEHEIELTSGAYFNNLEVTGVNVRLGRKAFLEVAGDLRNYNGSINGSGDLQIVASGRLENISGIIQAEGDLLIGAHSIDSQTIVHRYDFGSKQGGRFGEIASFTSGGDITLRSYSDIMIQGGVVDSGGSIEFAADGDILIGQVGYTEHEATSGRGWKRETTLTQHLMSSVTAADSLEIIARGSIKIDGSELIAGTGHIELLADLGIEVLDVQAQRQYTNFRKSGNTTVNESSYRTVAMRALLDAGKDIRIHSGFGNITLRAAEISSVNGTSVTAANGEINMLMTVENDQYNYSSVSERLFTTTTVNRGHSIETAVPNTIVGGFQAEALYGLNVEYEGVEGEALEDQINAFREIEELAWIANIYDSDEVDVDWSKIETEYREWNKSSTSLSAAAIALITIVVAVCTAGVGASMIGAAGTTSAGAVTATGAMMNAGFTAMVTTASIATANAAVNGGDLEDIVTAGFEAVHSEEGLKSAAIAMVTAGAIAQIDAKFFSPTDADLSAAELAYAADRGVSVGQLSAAELLEARSAAHSLTFVRQAQQALAHSAAKAGISALTEGASFTDSFKSSLLQTGISTLGQTMASSISQAAADSNFEKVFDYIAHAGAGCIVGELQNAAAVEKPSDGCASGALGSVVSHVVSDLYEASHRDEIQQLNNDEVQQFADWHLEPGITQREIYLRSLSSQNHIRAKINSLQASGVDIAKLAGAFSAFVAGLDVNTAANTAETTSSAVMASFAVSMVDQLNEAAELDRQFRAANIQTFYRVEGLDPTIQEELDLQLVALARDAGIPLYKLENGSVFYVDALGKYRQLSSSEHLKALIEIQSNALLRDVQFAEAVLSFQEAALEHRERLREMKLDGQHASALFESVDDVNSDDAAPLYGTPTLAMFPDEFSDTVSESFYIGADVVTFGAVSLTLMALGIDVETTTLDRHSRDVYVAVRQAYVDEGGDGESFDAMVVNAQTAKGYYDTVMMIRDAGELAKGGRDALRRINDDGPEYSPVEVEAKTEGYPVEVDESYFNVPEGEDTVSIFKAPQRGKGTDQYNNGYNAEDFCDGDQCAYFAKNKELAETYKRYYGEGVIELKIPKSTYDERLKKHEYSYQGSSEIELPVPHSEFDVLNNAERVWHK